MTTPYDTVACRLTQENLINVLTKHSMDSAPFKECFFKPAYTNGTLIKASIPTMFLVNVADPVLKERFVLENGVVIPPLDDRLRCRNCACPIPVHPQAADQPAAKKQRREDENDVEAALDPQKYRRPPLPFTEVSQKTVRLLNREMKVECMLTALQTAIAQQRPGHAVCHPVIATVAISGAGKTEMLRQVCDTIAHEAFKPRVCRTVYLSYQSYPSCVPLFPLNPHAEPSEEQLAESYREATKYFACLILMACGVAPGAARTVVAMADPLVYGIKFLRAVLKAETLPLVICVDELVHLDAQCPGNSYWTLHTLMTVQDENNSSISGPPLYFVFSALHESMIKKPASAGLPTTCSRPVTVIPLRPLTLDHVFACVAPVLMRRASPLCR